MIDLYLLVLNFSFLLRVHPVRGPRATQGKGILCSVVWAWEKAKKVVHKCSYVGKCHTRRKWSITNTEVWVGHSGLTNRYFPPGV